MADINADFRRLAARGYFEITPSTRPVHDGTRQDSDGTVWELSHFEPCIHLQWAPKGQAGPGGDARFNPFCSKAFTGATLAEVLSKAVEVTRPPSWSLESLVSHWLYERERARRKAASDG